MKLQLLDIQKNNLQNKKLINEIDKMEILITALKAKELPDSITSTINIQINTLNSFTGTEKELKKSIQKTYTNILKSLKNELKYVSINHYKTLWMVLGMSVFGLPIGIVFSAALGNYGFLGLGLPIGILIGFIYGTKLDKKAEADDLQLNITS